MKKVKFTGNVGEYVIFPEVGLVKKNAEGFFELPSIIVQYLAQNSDWVLVEEKEDSVEVELTVESLNAFNLSELVDLVKSSDYPKKEWAKYLKDEQSLRLYLSNKLFGVDDTLIIEPESSQTVDSGTAEYESN